LTFIAPFLSISPFSSFVSPDSSYYKLVNPYRRDHNNLQVFKRAIKNIVQTSSDTGSVGRKFFDLPELTERQKIDDLVGIMIAGSETTSHTLVSCLYFMSRHPETLQKLREELNREGLSKGEAFVENCTLETLQNCTYLSCVVKETLRLDSAVADTFDYEPSRDITICGVPISKGQRIKIDLLTNHFDSDKWLDPEAFIPDRHDTESEFFKKSKEAGKVADVYARRSFSHGNRNCPGQSFALLEARIVIAYLATHIDYEFDLEVENEQGVGFGLATQFLPRIRAKMHGHN